MARVLAESFYDRIHARSLEGLWEVMPKLFVDRSGRLEAPPPFWRWQEIRPLLLEAAEAPIERGSERRNLVMRGPGTPEAATTHTMAVGVQYIKPGEVAACHRHCSAALRFVVEGSGGYTAVEGEKIAMAPGDLILTPHWTWHYHGNDGPEPTVWMDGLDVPFVAYLRAEFVEWYPEPSLPPRHPAGYSRRRVGSGLVRPTAPIAERALPLIYPWAEVYPELLRQQAAGDHLDPHDGILLEYVNPLSGGPTLPTLSCRMQLLPAGFEAAAHRHTSSVIYRVFRGRGWSDVGGHRIDWEAGDCFVVPVWIWHAHHAAADEDAILFSMSDRPILDAFDLYREEPADVT
jgi:gentisate 1,2-dioxygenase